jgi:hypothetical protein
MQSGQIVIHWMHSESKIQHTIFPGVDHCIRVCLSENGVIDSVLTLEWMKVFDAETKKILKDKTEWRQLLIDSHRTHLQGDYVGWAYKHRIDITGYPPHSTHELQGLDKVCFAPLKREISIMKDQHRRKTGHAMSKTSFMAQLKTSFDLAFTQVICKAAFRETGVYPISIKVIPDDAIAPSETRSIDANFGVPQPEEVHELLPLLEHVRQKRHAEHEASTSASGIKTPPRMANASSLTAPLSPSFFNIDPKLLTPRTRKLVDAAIKVIEQPTHLAAPQTPRQSRSQSGSLSCSPTPEMLRTPVIPRIEDTPTLLRQALLRPDDMPMTMEEAVFRLEDLHEATDLYRKQMNRFREVDAKKNAMLTLQNLRLREQNRKLITLGKQKSRKKERTIRILSTKHGRHLSGPAFRAAVRLDALERDEKERIVERNRNKRELGKSRREWEADERARRKEQRRIDLEQWEEAKNEAVESGQRKPKRPAMPKKESTPPELIWNSPESSDADEDVDDEFEE